MDKELSPSIFATLLFGAIALQGLNACAKIDDSGTRRERSGPPPSLCASYDCASEIAAGCSSATTFATRITCAHNLVRKFASPPPAVPLIPLTYDRGLAKIAQTWAVGCVEGHNPDRMFGGSMAGENLAFFTDTSLTPTAAADMSVKLWAGETEFYDYANNSCEPGQICGHYTQVVWQESRLLGCAIAKSCGGSFAVHVVCNYSPPGNFIGEFPYQLP